MPVAPRSTFWIVLLLICIATYWWGLGSPFLFDSITAIARNPALQFDSTSFIQWYNALFSSESGPTGRPLSMASFALNIQLAGSVSPFALKLTNVVLHFAMALLGYRVFCLLLLNSPRVDLEPVRVHWLAATAVALWLLHPLQVSTVLYAVQRMEQLAAMSTLAALLVYAHYRPRWLERLPTVAELSAFLFGLTVCLAVGVLCKEDAVLMVPVVLLAECVFFGGQLGGRRYRWINFICVLAVLSPLLLIGVILWWQPDFVLRGYWNRDFTMAERVLTQSRVLWQYVAWVLGPDIRPLALHHDDIMVSGGLWQPWTTALSLAGWLLALVAAVAGRRRWPLFSFALGWFLLLHVLEASVWPLELVWEHRNYLPSMGVCLLVAWVIWALLPLPSMRQRLLLSGLLALLLALQLFNRASLWGDEEIMAAYHLQHHPDSLRSTYHFANLQLRRAEAATETPELQRRLALSRQYYLEMLRLDPGSFTALVTLLYLDSRYFDTQAEADWGAQLLASAQQRRVNNNDHAALGLLLDCLARQQCAIAPQQAVSVLETLIARYPRRADYPHYLAVLYGNVLGDYPRALALHEELLQRYPQYLAAWDGKAAWNNRSGSLGQALEALRGGLAEDASTARVSHVISSFEADTQ